MSALTAQLPLRTTAVWGGFADVRAIPHRYGRVSGALLQYDSTGRIWCWADHPVQGIDAIAIDGATVSNWQFRNDIDNVGHAVALVEFDQPQTAGTTIIASGRGKPHPTTGALMDAPADVIWDVLANIASADIARSQMDDFHKATLARGLFVGGSIIDAQSAQVVARSIAASVGAIFSAGARGLCHLWPGGTTPPTRGSISALDDATAQATIDDLCNDLTVQFGMIDGYAQQSIHLRAPASITRFGARPQTVSLDWVQAGRVAIDVGTRMLAQAARPQWKISATTTRDLDARIGDAITIGHPLMPASGDFIVQAVVNNLDGDQKTFDVFAAMGDAPVVELVNQGATFAPGQIDASAASSAYRGAQNQAQPTTIISYGAPGHGSTKTTAAPTASGANWAFAVSDATAFAAVGMPVFCGDGTNSVYGTIYSVADSAHVEVAPIATTGTVTSIAAGSTFTFSGMPGVPGGGGSSPLTTKGDLYVFNTADARLPVGSDGQVLTADSTAAAGVKWAAGGGNTGDPIFRISLVGGGL